MYGRVLSILAIVLVALAAGALVLVGYLWQTDDHTGSLTAASAMATFVLASVAVLTLRQNDKLVHAAIDEATATREQATASKDQAMASRETVEEMRLEHERAYKPAIVVAVEKRHYEGGPIGITKQMAVLRNIGTGPAFNVRLAVHRPAKGASEGKEATEHRWLSSEWQGMMAGGESEFPLTDLSGGPKTEGPRPDRYRGIVDDVQSMDGEAVYAVRYDDWFGNHYRVIGPAIRPAEEYRGHPSEASAPDWARVS